MIFVIHEHSHRIPIQRKEFREQDIVTKSGNGLL